MFSQASNPTNSSGTTSSALNTDPALAGGAHRHEFQPREEKRDHDGREHLEEALDPEVHDPPAPVLGHRQVGLPAVAERRDVEHSDRRRRNQEHRQQRPLVVRLLQGGQHRADHQRPPEKEEQQDLPESAEVDVVGVGERAGGNGVLFAAVGEDIRVVRGAGFERLGAYRIDGDRAVAVGVLAEELFEAALEFGLLCARQ